MALPADPRPGRRPRRRFFVLFLLALVVGTAGFAVFSIGRSAGWTWPGLGVAGIDSPIPTTAPTDTGSGSPPPTASPAPTPSANPSPPPPSPTPSLDLPSPSPSLPVVDTQANLLRAQLQARLDRDRRRLAIPGVSVTILFRDGSSWTGTSGLADVATRTKVTADTAFALGSVSKTYTAALIVALAGDGRIQLDAPAARYLPGVTMNNRITVRMLLDHTSGLDDFFLHPPIDKALLAQRDATWSSERALSYVGKRYFAPGKGWHYSNTNYVYLGLIAQNVTGSSLATALRKRFFTPLGLDATWYQAFERPRAEVAHGYRFNSPALKDKPIDLADGSGVAPFTSVVTAAGGAGSIAATSSDVARWARQLYDGTAIGIDQTAIMLNDVATTATYRPRVPYGLGVQVFPILGRPSFGHSGRLLGFRAAVRHFPDDQTTIAVLTNQSRTDPGIIVEHLLKIAFAPEPACVGCVPTP